MALATRTSLRTAWRESPAVIRAMGAGRHFLLLGRTGSDPREREARLTIQHLEFFLFPSRQEIARDALRPDCHQYLEGSADAGDDGVTLRYKAVVTDGLMVMQGAQLRGLEPFHIWSERHLAEATRWDPLDPAFLMLCKVHRLDPPLQIPWRAEYAAAGPWLQLPGDPLPPAAFVQAVPHVDYLKVVVDVKKALAEAQKNPMQRPEPPPPASA